MKRLFVLLAALVAMSAVVAGSAFAGGAHGQRRLSVHARSRTAALGSPVITSLKVAGRKPLPAAGAPMTVKVIVRNGVSCTFKSQLDSFDLTAYKTVPCASGAASVVIPAIPNPRHAPFKLVYSVRVTGVRGQSVERRVSVPQASARPVSPPSPPPPPWRVSGNWSGYVLPSPGTPVTFAGGQFTVPILNCRATPNAGVGVWAGIGGDPSNQGSSDGSLLQTGVTSECVNGIQSDVGWWEEFPQYSAVNFSSFSVSPGDHIKAEVYQSSNGSWVTWLDDESTGLAGIMVSGEGWGVEADTANSFYYQGRTATLTYGGGYTAEWIAEAYTQGDGTQATLANYGTVTFTNLQMNPAGLPLLPSDEVALQPQGAPSVISTPSAAGADTSFSVTYTG